jgi:hypothetical protein
MKRSWAGQEKAVSHLSLGPNHGCPLGHAAERLAQVAASAYERHVEVVLVGVVVLVGHGQHLGLVDVVCADLGWEGDRGEVRE